MKQSSSLNNMPAHAELHVEWIKQSTGQKEISVIPKYLSQTPLQKKKIYIIPTVFTSKFLLFSQSPPYHTAAALCKLFTWKQLVKNV